MTLPIKQTALAVTGLWSGLISCAVMAQASDPVLQGQKAVVTREMAVRRAVDAALGLDAQQQSIAAKEAVIRQAGLKPNPFIAAEVENFTGSGPYTGLGRSEVTFSYNQRVERGDKRQHRQRLATKDRDIAQIEWRLKRLNLIRLVEQAYVATVVARMKRDSQQEQREIFAETLRTLMERKARGRVSELTVQNARLQLMNADRKVAQQQIDLAVFKNKLAGFWQTVDVNFTVDERELFALPEILKGKDVRLEEGPDLLYWHQRISRSTDSVSLERSKSVQDITYNVGLKYLQGSGGNVAAVAGISMPFALYDTNVNNVRKARAQLKKSQIDMMSAKRDLSRQLLLQKQIRASAFAQLRQINSRLIPEARRTEQIAQQRLKQGVATYLDVYAAQSVVAGFKTQLIAELEKFHMAQTEINRLSAKYDVAGPDGLNFDDMEGEGKEND